MFKPAYESQSTCSRQATSHQPQISLWFCGFASWRETLLLMVAVLSVLSSCDYRATDANAPPYPTYDASLPNPIPSSCPQNTTLDPATLTADLRARTPYWIGNATLLVGRADSPVWRSGDNRVWWRAAEQPSVQVNLLEGSSPPANILWKDAQSDVYASTVTLPKVGCWEFLATVKGQLVRFLVYVYPSRVVP